MKTKCKIKFLCAFETIYLKQSRVNASKPSTRNSFHAYLRQVEATTRVNALQMKCKVKLLSVIETLNLHQLQNMASVCSIYNLKQVQSQCSPVSI